MGAGARPTVRGDLLENSNVRDDTFALPLARAVPPDVFGGRSYLEVKLKLKVWLELRCRCRVPCCGVVRAL